ncbi:MAG: ATP-dependent sacrificial sulfur transferase LarE [Polyangiaceae bacterium]|nr:ATP-dependent sacrificial sulfur transferase LarE [Polyangiaceae bacterium]
MPSSPATNLARLEAIFGDMGSVLVCYSGGLDSALVLAVAHRVLGPRAVGMTAVSPSLAPSEKDDAERLAEKLGAPHRLVESHEIERAGYAANQADRCFHCKTELYDIAAAKRVEWGLDWIANGTNLDDLGDYRPGLDAARAASVRSPLVEAELRKEDARAVARAIGLDVWDKPAAACLSSRIPYGTSVTRERLAQVGGFEEELRALGFRRVRARFHDTLVRVEVDPEELPRIVSPEVRHAVAEAGRRHGFVYVTVDLVGYRQGSHNEVLHGRALRVL